MNDDIKERKAKPQIRRLHKITFCIVRLINGIQSIITRLNVVLGVVREAEQRGLYTVWNTGFSSQPLVRQLCGTTTGYVVIWSGHWLGGYMERPLVRWLCRQNAWSEK